MVDEVVREVTIDRISNRGNPIAAEKYSGRHIIVDGGRPGDTLEVKLTEQLGALIGKIVEPTSEEEDRMKEDAKIGYGPIKAGNRKAGLRNNRLARSRGIKRKRRKVRRFVQNEMRNGQRSGANKKKP